MTQVSQTKSYKSWMKKLNHWEFQKASETSSFTKTYCLVCILILFIDSKSKTPFMKSMRRYCSTLFSRDKKLKFPETKYFENSFVKFVFEVVNHPAFTLFIFIVIGLNTITLCLDFYRLEGICKFKIS